MTSVFSSNYNLWKRDLFFNSLIFCPSKDTRTYNDPFLHNKNMYLDLMILLRMVINHGIYYIYFCRCISTNIEVLYSNLFYRGFFGYSLFPFLAEQVISELVDYDGLPTRIPPGIIRSDDFNSLDIWRLLSKSRLLVISISWKLPIVSQYIIAAGYIIVLHHPEIVLHQKLSILLIWCVCWTLDKSNRYSTNDFLVINVFTNKISTSSLTIFSFSVHYSCHNNFAYSK